MSELHRLLHAGKYMVTVHITPPRRRLDIDALVTALALDGSRVAAHSHYDEELLAGGSRRSCRDDRIDDEVRQPISHEGLRIAATAGAAAVSIGQGVAPLQHHPVRKLA